MGNLDEAKTYLSKGIKGLSRAMYYVSGWYTVQRYLHGNRGLEDEAVRITKKLAVWRLFIRPNEDNIEAARYLKIPEGRIVSIVRSYSRSQQNPVFLEALEKGGLESFLQKYELSRILPPR